MINEYNKSDLFRTFQKLDIKKGDSIFLSTSLGMLGKPQTSNKNILLTVSHWILKSLEKLIGKNGNIFVPTYSYSFTKKNKIFSVKNTKSTISRAPDLRLT